MKNYSIILGAAAFFAGTTSSALDQQASTGVSPEATAPRTEHASNPLGIDVEQPCLSWQMTASARGARQTAYRVQVAESQEALAGGQNLLWDTGKVDSDRWAHSAPIAYWACCWPTRRRARSSGSICPAS